MHQAEALRRIRLVSPPARSRTLAALERATLAPSIRAEERWEYGTNIDWAGRMVEIASGQDLDAFMRENIFAPLGMRDSGFIPDDQQFARGAQVHNRLPDGSLQPVDRVPPAKPEFFGGGGALFSTGPDYLMFLRMLMNGGALNGARILAPETVALMAQNHIGDLTVQKPANHQPRRLQRCRVLPRHGEEVGPDLADQYRRCSRAP